MQKFLMRMFFVTMPALLVSAVLFAFGLIGTGVVAFIFIFLLGIDVTRARTERGEF